VKLAGENRHKFKEPLGVLVPDSNVTCDMLCAMAQNSEIITVGDATTQRVLDCGIIPVVHIVDGLEKRSRRNPPSSNCLQMQCKNPPGEITQNAVSVIQQAIAAMEPVRVLVRGEEDLLVLPVCIHAPLGSTILYGQPNQGLVVIRLTKQVRDKADFLLSIMDKV